VVERIFSAMNSDESKNVVAAIKTADKALKAFDKNFSMQQESACQGKIVPHIIPDEK